MAYHGECRLSWLCERIVQGQQLRDVGAKNFYVAAAIMLHKTFARTVPWQPICLQDDNKIEFHQNFLGT
jgi:hypothetical protein